jgi:type I restriction enzyme M protein
MDSYAKDYGDTPELIAEMMKNERFVLPEDASFYALHKRRHEAGNGERIDKALHAIEEANISKLRDVFQDISFNSNKLGVEKQKNDLLRHLLEDFAKPELNMRPSRIGNLDVIGNAYEYLIKNFASDAGRKAGEFYTPPEVSELMAEIMDMNEGEEACDPACGSGSLLMKCGRRVQAKTGSKKYALYGQESIGSTWALAKMNIHAGESVPKYAHLATPDEIAGNDWNLNIPRYVDTFEEEVEIDLVAVRAERLKLKDELAMLEAKMDGYLKELGF